jgi:hypothetical protein
MLKECFRILKPAGVLRIVVPDLRAMVLDYLGEGVEIARSTKTNHQRADLLVEKLHFYPREPPPPNVAYRLYLAVGDLTAHKWMYDAKSLVEHLRWAGFVEVGEMAFRESRIQGIAEVEMPGRVLNGEGICVEGLKPRQS